MLKISEGKRTNQTTTLRLEGRVIGPWVGELGQVCELLLKDGRRLALDLAEVGFADEHGLTLLGSLKRRGARLLNASPFVEEQLKSSASVATQRPGNDT